MKIRKAVVSDLQAVSAIYEQARRFMAASGNPGQWGDSHPPIELLIEDIAEDRLFVCEEGRDILGVFAYIRGDDPTYSVIEEGSWHSDEPYGTLHRVAKAPAASGILEAAAEFAARQLPYVRIDTHENNIPMQKAIARCGFKKCGRIYVADGSPRIAYDRTSE